MLLCIALYCRGDASADDQLAQLENFEKKVRPLLVEHCYECHANQERSGGLTVDHREGLLKGGDSGPAVVSGKPSESRLLEAVRYGNPELQMPPAGRLSDAEITVLEEWIAQGAVDPREASGAQGRSRRAWRLNRDVSSGLCARW